MPNRPLPAVRFPHPIEPSGASEGGPHSPTAVREFGWSQVNAWLLSSTVARPDFDSYLICATPRSGSTLLCGLLESSGVAGHPASYFNRDALNEYANQWGIPRPRDGRIDRAFVQAALTAGRTPNGIFGVRVMQETLPELVRALSVSAADPVDSELDPLTDVFGRIKFIHLRRCDVVAQAVSWARSLQTHFWHPGEAVLPGGQEPHYDEGLISQLVARIGRSEAGWASWFDAHGIEALEVTYEELAADCHSAALSVIGFLGLELPEGRTLESAQRQQADELNAAWIHEFKARSLGVGQPGQQASP